MMVKILIEMKEDKVAEMAGKIHNSLVGNQDYIDSNMGFNYDIEKGDATVYFNMDDCDEDSDVAQKAANVISIVNDIYYNDNTEFIKILKDKGDMHDTN